MLDGSDIVYVERIQAGLVRLGVDVRIGSRAPVYSTAIGHAILAFMPQENQIEVLEAQPRPRRTETTITDLNALLRRLNQVKSAGYAVSNQENVSGLCVLAAPMLDLDGVPLAAVSVAAPTMRHFGKRVRARRRRTLAQGGRSAVARPPGPGRRHLQHLAILEPAHHEESRMTVMTNFHGIIPAIAVPFRTDHSIDEAELRRFATWLARRKGIVGLMTNGHTGEVFSLTARARRSDAHHRQGHQRHLPGHLLGRLRRHRRGVSSTR